MIINTKLIHKKVILITVLFNLRIMIVQFKTKNKKYRKTKRKQIINKMNNNNYQLQIKKSK